MRVFANNKKEHLVEKVPIDVCRVGSLQKITNLDIHDMFPVWRLKYYVNNFSNNKS